MASRFNFHHPLLIFSALMTLNAFPNSKKSFRTFVTLKSYHLAQSGNALPNHHIQLKVKLGEKETSSLPQRELAWTLPTGGTKAINQTFEIPFEVLSSDSFSFEVQMLREGKTIEPCRFAVTQVSQYNRNYVCRSDVNHQTRNQNLPSNKISKEAIEVRVFTSLNTPKKEIPRQVIALN